MLGQTVYAANREERRLARQYPSYNKRVKQVHQKVHHVTAHLHEDDFKHNPHGLVRYKLEKAVEGGNLPVESRKLVKQIHRLKRNQSYVSGASNSSSVGTKIAPVEPEPEPVELEPVPVAPEPVPVVFHADLLPRPPQEPSLCSDCVIL
jgi:hypothetical protein